MFNSIWSQLFDWLLFTRKAFKLPNKIHRTNMLAVTYTISQGISKWSAKIVITGLFSLAFSINWWKIHMLCILLLLKTQPFVLCQTKIFLSKCKAVNCFLLMLRCMCYEEKNNKMIFHLLRVKKKRENRVWDKNDFMQSTF